MQVPAFYIADPAVPGVYTTCTVRVHTKQEALGEVAGTSFDYAEKHEFIPRLIFLVDEVPEPERGGVVTITDPVTGDLEAYMIDNRLPKDGITVTAEVTVMTASQYTGLPFPEA